MTMSRSHANLSAAAFHRSEPRLNFDWNEKDNDQQLSPKPVLQSMALVDLGARRSISDSVLNRGPPAQYNHKNTSYMLISRSGGPTVKQMIDVIVARCDEAVTGTAQVRPPCDECSALAQFAGDAYYNVVIAGRQGIRALVRAMRTWPEDRGLQECCCITLGNLCLVGSGANLAAIEQAGGIPVIIQAMRIHSTSVAVQSAACDALRNMGSLIGALDETSPQVKNELEAALSHASQMYLLPVHRSIAETLLAMVQSTAQRV